MRRKSKEQPKFFSRRIRKFYDRIAPEEGFLVGYGTLIDFYRLPVSLPAKLALISLKNLKYEVPGWRVLDLKHKPEDSLKGHLLFALKYEGVDLLFFVQLFNEISESEIIDLVLTDRTNPFIRKIWYLYEFFNQRELPIEDLTKERYIFLIDKKLQPIGDSYIISKRHRIKNNLPATKGLNPNVDASKARYLRNYEKMEIWLKKKYKMLESTIDKLISMLDRSGGTFQKTVRKKEFRELNDQQIERIEKRYYQIFLNLKEKSEVKFEGMNTVMKKSHRNHSAEEMKLKQYKLRVVYIKKEG